MSQASFAEKDYRLKINARSLLVYLLAAVVFFHPFDIYRIDVAGLPFSISRLFLGATLLLWSFLLLISVLEVRRHKANIIVLLYFGVPFALSIARITNSEILSLLMGSVFLILVLQNVDGFKQHLALVRAFELSFVWYVFFGFYTYYFYGRYGVPLRDIPFRGLIPLELLGAGHIQESKGFMIGAGYLALPRLSLPLSTPPATSLALSLGIVLFFSDKTLLKSISVRIFRGIMLLMLFFCLMLTMSKSGMLMFVFAMISFSVLHIVRYKSIDKKLMLKYFLIIPIIALVLSYLPIDNVITRYTDSRILQVSVTHHFNSRLDALAIATENISRFLFGAGYGNYRLYGEGIHSHSPITTNLVELGIVGSLFFWALYIYTAVANYRCLRALTHLESKYKYRAAFYLLYFVGIISILFSALLYEAITIWPMYIFVALSLSMVVLWRSSTYVADEKICEHI